MGQSKSQPSTSNYKIVRVLNLELNVLVNITHKIYQKDGLKRCYLNMLPIIVNAIIRLKICGVNFLEVEKHLVKKNMEFE